MISRVIYGSMNLKIKVFGFLCLLCLLFPSIVSAQIPYTTSFKDQQSLRDIRIQPIYMPWKIIDGNNMKIPLNAPSDLYIATDNHVYIADTGNNRIVELNAEGDYIRSIGQEEGPGKLNQPEGVFVAEDGTIYVANTGDRTIVKFNAKGQLDKVFPKPVSNLLYEDYFFIPTKLVVDNRGVMYIVVKDSYQGLLRMNPEGKFTGFFGANKTKLDWLDQLKRTILSKQQMEKETAKRPNAIENVTLTNEGFLVTTSSGNVNDGQIKKLNAGGVDAFQNKAFRELQLVDVAIDTNGFLYGMNQDYGDISIYDPNGRVMFYFGGGDKNARQLGVTSFATSIAINGNNELWVVDNGLNLIHVFKRTSFGETFLTAAHLYFEGEYTKSKAYWEEVIRQNGMMDISFDGLGKISLHEQDYAAALDYFKESHDAQGYSDAFWNVRYEWIQNNFLFAFIILMFAVSGLVFLLRKWSAFTRNMRWLSTTQRYWGEIKDALYLTIHPYEGFYRLKDRKISLFVILLILSLAIGIHILSIFSSGFISYPYDLGRFNIKFSLAIMIVPWVTWVIANYLVSSVKGGEGRFREVFQASTFAVVPFILMTIPVILLSNILVAEEWILIDLIKQIMWLWIILLLFVMTQVIHNFDFFEAIKNVCITLFTIGVIWIFVIIFSGLGLNLYDFFTQIYREVTFHG